MTSIDTEKMIVARAPGRITFCGGGSDVSPIPEKFGGFCLNAGINKYVTTKFRWRPDEKIEIYNLKTKEKLKLGLNELKNLKRENIIRNKRFDMPLAVSFLFAPKIDRGFNIWILPDVELHSGLGTSATVFTSLIGVFNEALGLGFNRSEIAETAFFLESEVLGHTTGRQDQYAAAYGGFNLFEFNGDQNVKVNPLVLSHNTINELRDNLLLFFLFPRIAVSAGEIEKDKVRTFTSVEKFEPVLKVKKMAVDASKILLSGDLTGFADLLHNNWEEKKKHSTLVSNKKIDRFYEEIRKEGALAGKIIGAGGGGHMLVFCSPLNKMKVIRKAQELGAKNIDFELASDGLTVWHSDWHQEENTILYK